MFQTIRILMVDDHQLTCTAVRSLLLDSVNMMLLAEIPSLINFQQICIQYEPHILFLSYDLVRESQSTLAATLKRYPAIKIVWVVSNCNDIYLADFVENDIQGCILRDRIPDELIPVIYSTIADIRCYSTPVVKKLRQLQRNDVVSGEVDNVSLREKEVLCLLANGLANKEIALQLQIANSTVEYHVGNILKKLDLNSRVEAAVWAKTHNLI